MSTLKFIEYSQAETLRELSLTLNSLRKLQPSRKRKIMNGHIFSVKNRNIQDRSLRGREKNI